MRKRMLTLAACVLAAGAASAEKPGARSVTATPGAEYDAGWLHRILFGSHWREAWTTPIEVPVLDLARFDGGLRPYRTGGGQQTFNLRFWSANGKDWVFRSVDKDPSKAFDAETRAGMGGVAKDFTSGPIPAAGLVVAPLLEAAGILHATPQLAVMPDDPALGEFRAEFAGMLGLLEERIEHRISGGDKTEDTLQLFHRLEERSDEWVDAKDYLRCRLIDLLVGDWDRHIDQYRWVRVRQGGNHVWRVVPRDRDAAFQRFDGIVPSFGEYYTKKLAGWGSTYPPIDKITFSARYSDRRFLVPLDGRDWEEVAADLVPRLNDEVISDAVRHLPPEIYAKVGEKLESDLRSRRDLIPHVAREFYELLAKDVDVHGTTGPEEFDVERQASGAVVVAVHAKDDTTGAKAAAPFFRRIFLPGETAEIRLYTLGGRDRIVVLGSSTAITVRVISPPDTAEIAGERAGVPVYGPIAPPPPTTSVPTQAIKSDPNQAALAQYTTPRDWGHDTLFSPLFGYDASRGIVAGPLMQRTGFGFQLEPFASRMSLAAVWATTPSRPRLELNADIRTRSPVRLLFYGAYSGIDEVSFYGLGNDTTRNSTLASHGYYQSRQDFVIVNPMLEMMLPGDLRGRIGALFKHGNGVDNSGFYVDNGRPYGTNGASLGSGELSLLYDTMRGTLITQRGIRFQVNGFYTPAIFSNDAAFEKVRGEISANYATRTLTDVYVSGRLAGERVWGRHPFFESAFIGGIPNLFGLDITGAGSGNLLRGYDLNRFAGDASLVANSELGLQLGKSQRYGLFGLFDVGRVWVANLSSDTWHTGYGGGLWLNAQARGEDFQFDSAIKAAVTHSVDGTSFYLTSSFMF